MRYFFDGTNFPKAFEIRRVCWFLFRVTKKETIAERTVSKIFLSHKMAHEARMRDMSRFLARSGQPRHGREAFPQAL